MRDFIRKESVFVIAALAAVLSAFFNPPSAEWVDAIDFRTLALLFSLMGVSEGLKASGFFDSAAGFMMKESRSLGRLSFLLAAIVFLSSMLFTNDVSLLMFVPFTMMLLDREGIGEDVMIRLVVIETIAANLGSMTTPVGNPQNLYICSFFSVEAWPFFRTILPYSALSAILLALSVKFLIPSSAAINDDGREIRKMEKSRTVIYLLFLLAAMLSVFHVISWKLLFAAELAFLIVHDRNILRKIDYILLLTFVAFFIFSANVGSIDGIRALLTEPMREHPAAVSALISQIISNVPAAILLSPFSERFEGVLIGTDIGGLGTPIASLASLISLKFYFRRKEGRKARYIAFFLLMNAAFLVLLSLLAFLIGR